MTQMTTNEETKAVRHALISAGFEGIHVTKGTGSSYGWIYVHHATKGLGAAIRCMVLDVTGRTGRDAEMILIQWDN